MNFINFKNYLLSKLYSKMEIKFKRISDDAIVPTQNTATDAGYDLFSTEDYVLKK
jgi:dUTPase